MLAAKIWVLFITSVVIVNISLKSMLLDPRLGLSDASQPAISQTVLVEPITVLMLFCLLKD